MAALSGPVRYAFCSRVCMKESLNKTLRHDLRAGAGHIVSGGEVNSIFVAFPGLG